MLHLSNIGSNQTELTANGVKVLFSYQTPVAAWINGEYFKTDKKYSKTTTKHINNWVHLAIEKPEDFFDNLVKQFKLDI